MWVRRLVAVVVLLLGSVADARAAVWVGDARCEEAASEAACAAAVADETPGDAGVQPADLSADEPPADEPSADEPVTLLEAAPGLPPAPANRPRAAADAVLRRRYLDVPLRPPCTVTAVPAVLAPACAFA